MSTSNDGSSDRGPGIIAAAIVAAALILSWGKSNNEPHYQLASSGESVVRMDTDSGELIACTVKGCNRIEAPDRAKTFGPLTVEIGDDAEKKAPPLPENEAN